MLITRASGKFVPAKIRATCRVRVGLMALLRVRRAISLPRWRRARYFWPDKRFLSFPPSPMRFAFATGFSLTRLWQKKKVESWMKSIRHFFHRLLINFSIVGVRLSVLKRLPLLIELNFSFLSLLYGFEYLILERKLNGLIVLCDLWESRESENISPRDFEDFLIIFEFYQFYVCWNRRCNDYKIFLRVKLTLFFQLL